MKTLRILAICFFVVCVIAYICWYAAQFLVNQFGDRLTAALFIGAFAIGTLFLFFMGRDASRARRRTRKW